MRLDNSAGRGTHCHTPPQGTDNAAAAAAAVPSRISAALFSNRAAVWGYRALEKNHTFLKRVESLRESEGEAQREGERQREEVAGVCEVSSWPSWTPRGTLRNRNTRQTT